MDFGVDKKWVPAAIGLNYEVRAGEVLAIVGESGSGKSASSMALLGLLPSNSRVTGSVKLAGQELLGANEANIRAVRGKDVAVIFQEPMTALNPVYTVGAQIVETVRLHSEVSPEEARLRALRMLELVELPDPEKAFRSYPHQLSGGQRQRAMIAQSLSCDPKLLIADEPTTALDVTVQAEILDLMRNLRNKLDSAIVLITHDMGVVADLADRIAVMRKGLIVETGTAAQIFHNPQHEYTQALLAAVPHLGQGGADSAADVDVTAALAAATHAEILSIPEEELIRRERENAAALAAAESRQAAGRTGPGAHATSPSNTRSRAGCRPSGPWKAPTWSSTPARWSASWASPVPARPPSAGPPSACCRSRPAPCGWSGRTFPPPRRTAGSSTRCAGMSAWCSRTRRRP